MDSENEELYLIKLKRFIYDEDKIVTVAWLSKELNLEIHACRKLLKQFVDDETSSNALGVTFTLSGILKNDKQCIMLVSHDKIKEKKKLFKEIKSENVYSIQKATDVNFNSVGLVDLFNIHCDIKPIAGSIIGKNCVKRTNIPSKVLPIVTRAPDTDKTKATHLFSNNKKSAVKTEASTSEKSTKKNGEVTDNDKKSQEKEKDSIKKLLKQNSDNKNKKQNALRNMFANAPPAKEKPKVKTESQDKADEAMDVDIQNDESDTDIPKNVNGKSENGKHKEKKKKQVKKDLYDSGTDEEAKKIEEENKKKKKATSNGKSSSEKKNENKRQRDKSVETSQKKRKRIVVPVESDDDIFGNDDDPEEETSKGIIESDEEEVKPTKALPPKNKKRKFVENTYTDEEGYIVTKKELVYESNDEPDENEAPPPPASQETQKKKQTSKKEVKEPSPPKKLPRKKSNERPANQPTLMNFFKKK